MDNISENDLRIFKSLAQDALIYTEIELQEAVNAGEFNEVLCNAKNLQQ